MYNVVSYKNKPAVVISKNDNVATVMYFIEEDNIVQAKTETIYDKNLLSDYKCPHADETDPARIYCNCSGSGKCMYMMNSPTELNYACIKCFNESVLSEAADEGIIER
jgi:hypothetical protein